MWKRAIPVVSKPIPGALEKYNGVCRLWWSASSSGKHDVGRTAASVFDPCRRVEQVFPITSEIDNARNRISRSTGPCGGRALMPEVGSPHPGCSPRLHH